MTDSVSLAVAFGGGLVSFVSPCVLPMVPVYLASLYGPELFERRGFRPAVLFHALSFVIGFAIVFVLLGAIAGLTGYSIIPNYHTLSKIAGWVLIAFGAFIVASYWVPWLNYERHLHAGAGRFHQWAVESSANLEDHCSFGSGFFTQTGGFFDSGN